MKSNLRGYLTKYGRELVTLIALGILIIIFSIANPIYLSPNNLIDIVDQSTINGLLALGITFAILTGGIDLSIGSTMAVTIVGVGYFLVNGLHPVAAVLLGIAIGAFLGFINGAILSGLKLQPFIVTMGTMSVYRGIAYIITKGWPVLNIPTTFRRMIDGDVIGSISMSVFILLIFAVVNQVILKLTKLGTYIYAIGGNEESTRLSGVNINYNKIMAYVICGIGASIAGMVMLARLGTGEPTAGQGYELNAIAAAAIGGTSLAGGKGSMVGTLIGAVLLSALRVGLVVMGVDSFWQYIATGGIIIIAASFEFIQNRLKQKKG